MPPGFIKLSEVAIYTPDLRASAELYRFLGLQQETPAEEPEPTYSQVIRFSQGETRLVLHDDAQRQFVEVTVSVEDVPTFYAQLARDPSYVWIETPRRVAGEWRAVVRLPDENVFTLASPSREPVPPAEETAPRVREMNPEAVR